MSTLAQWAIDHASPLLARLSTIDDPLALMQALTATGIVGERARFLASLAEARDKGPRKIPDAAAWWLLPIPLEQATTAPLAQFHARLLAGCKCVLDGTAGLGLDAAALGGWSPIAIPALPPPPPPCSLIAIERDPDTAVFLAANLRRAVRTERLAVHTRDLNDVTAAELREWQVDGIFLDPARRNKGVRGQPGMRDRHVSLHDCEPNVPAWLQSRGLLDGDARILVKAAPALDVTEVPADWSCLFVSLNGELKETLLANNVADLSSLGLPQSPSGKAPIAVSLRWDGSLEAALHLRLGAPTADLPVLSSRSDLHVGDIVATPDPAASRAHAWPVEGTPERLNANATVVRLAALPVAPDPFWKTAQVEAVTPARERDLMRAVRALTIHEQPGGPARVRGYGDTIPPALTRRLEHLNQAHGRWLLQINLGTDRSWVIATPTATV